ncbi:LysE/ArgO family amino acid transporter [Terasakiella sp. A23]|uniref:LysE/ArgO family amino acid transporter n=1 Tax=Terasakiella sp. FCG-A23 TaxID=3080561 RepID=UPI002952D2E6|nr:LysE/ArgO family amino acid transporter [Terasakiella sp. A23]MDV7338877.1 LysE/ArgO family amino acid transporter [Terasakiella sp. A23]
MSAFLSGMGLGASLIIAIGAQNAFVLGQGLRKNYPLSIALVCAVCDAILIVLGVAGLGSLIASSPLWTNIMAWGGAAFLFWYGLRSFQSLFSDHSLKQDRGEGKSRKEILLITLAITLLNPHVYLDTVVLLGGIASQYEDTARPYFALGAVIASFLWFLTISLGAAWASPYLARPITWKVIDAVTGCVMWLVAVTLVL